MKKDIHDIDVQALKEKHNAFLDRCSINSNKFDADQHLQRTRTFARIKYVLNILGSIGVVDQVKPEDTYGGEPHIYQLIKSEYHSSVKLSTNGTTVVLSSETENELEGNIHPVSKVYDVDAEDFNWDNFALHVLEYIQHVIYHSKEAYMLSIFKDQ